MTSNNEAQVVLLKMIHGNEIITKLLNKDELHYRIEYPLVVETKIINDRPIVVMNFWINHSKEQIFDIPVAQVETATVPLDSIMDTYKHTIKSYSDQVNDPIPQSAPKNPLIPGRILH